jgi:hypothetical protein
MHDKDDIKKFTFVLLHSSLQRFTAVSSEKI